MNNYFNGYMITKEYKIITEENFLYLEEKNGKIFARLKN